MVALPLYAYCSGVYSPRRIARACEERLDFQAVTALNQPDLHTISASWRRLDAMGGLVGLDPVAVDGTNIKANASRPKTMSYARMVEVEAELDREVAEWLARASRRMRPGMPSLVTYAATTSRTVSLRRVLARTGTPASLYRAI